MKQISDEGYNHTVDAWTVGRLRKALHGLPDDHLVAAAIPHDLRPRPLCSEDDNDWVLIDVEEGVGTHPAMLVFDRPTGRYVYVHREEEDEGE